MCKRITILMATYQGAKYLPTQLQSIADQSHRDWALYVSDDGSSDDSRKIVAEFAETQAAQGRMVRLLSGPGRGAAANFLHLQAQAGDHGWLAFADQDDQWLPDRLSRGVAALCDLSPETPALYCAATWVTDHALNGRVLSRLPRRDLGFRNALLQNVASGNTIVLNPAAAKLAATLAPATGAQTPALPAHDWWLYLLVTGVGGTVIFDPDPVLLYRQHGQNEIGANRGLRALFYRFRELSRGRLKRWSDANLAALALIEPYLTPENRRLYQEFLALRRRPLPQRLTRFLRLRLYRQSRLSYWAIVAALVLGRV